MDRFGILWDASVNEAVRETVGPIAPIFGILTHLGDGAFLIVLGVLIYWFGAESNRRRRMFVIAVGVAALALSAGLKGIVQLARPELAFAPGGYPGYSFPSAHAMGSAAFYGALAVSMTRGTRRLRYIFAGTVITVVALSRVVMGVHYVGDVLVGVLLGLGLVAVGLWTREEGLFEPGSMFALAFVIAGGAALLGSRVFLTLTIGASFGGLLGWYVVKDRPATESGAAVMVLGLLALLGLATIRLASLWIGLTLPDGPTPVLFFGEVVVYALLTAAMILLPWLAIRVESQPLVVRMQSHLPFRDRIIDIDGTVSED